MWPFSKKWTPPAPHLAMVVALANREPPSLIQLANPSGADGAVQGMAGPADQEPSSENMLTPMAPGDYVAISPAGGACALRVEAADPQSADGLSLDPELLGAAGLTPDQLDQFNRPVWRIILQIQSPAEEVRETVLFATRLAQRLAALGNGIVMDTCAYRFFGPDGWPVEEPNGDFDARAHVNIHIETEARWFHTHGLLKFGRPELEIYDVPQELEECAYAMLLDTAQYLINSALIAPGETCGDPNQPFFARQGTRNREGHWEAVPVLELVDVNERGRPVDSGAPKALQARAALQEG